MAHQMLEAKRTSRGKRMASLVGKAVEDDDAFWGNSIWGEEGSDNESFEAEDDQPDEFDSDFNDTETEGEEESEGEDGQDSSKRTKSKPTATSYKDSIKNTNKIIKKVQLEERAGNEDGPSIPKPKKRKLDTSIDGGSIDLTARTVRNSTKEKTSESDVLREKRLDEIRKRYRPIKIEKTQFNQLDLLNEALETEDASATWLSSRKFLLRESGEEKTTEKKKKPLPKEFIRYYAKRLVPPTITFSTLDLFHDYFPMEPEIPKEPEKTCVITGLPAKYRDPQTMLPYATLEAYQEIQRRYHTTVASSSSSSSSSYAASQTRNAKTVLISASSANVTSVVAPKETGRLPKKDEKVNMLDIIPADLRNILINGSELLHIPPYTDRIKQQSTTSTTTTTTSNKLPSVSNPTTSSSNSSSSSSGGLVAQRMATTPSRRTLTPSSSSSSFKHSTTATTMTTSSSSSNGITTTSASSSEKIKRSKKNDDLFSEINVYK